MNQETNTNDYAHWGEDAALIKDQEDRLNDYYSEEDPDDFYNQ